jgi:hypothetical protein
MGQANENGLHGFGRGAAGPCLSLAQFILQFVEELFDIPSAAG